jgi:hypothetical protein
MTIHLALGSTADTCHTVVGGHESREALYVGMSRGRSGNHVYLDLGQRAGEHAARLPDAAQSSTSVELLEHILANTSAPRSATTQRRPMRPRQRGCAPRPSVTDRPRRSAPGLTTGDERPLPWLPPLPSVDDPAWSDYLRRRFDLVRELAAEVGIADALPDARWATSLSAEAPELARLIAIWRTVHAVPPSDFRPCGAPDRDDDYQSHLHALVTERVGTMLGPTDRWQPLMDRLRSRDVDGSALAGPAAGLDRVEAGYDVRRACPN